MKDDHAEVQIVALWRTWRDLPQDATCDERQAAARAFVFAAEAVPEAPMPDNDGTSADGGRG